MKRHSENVGTNRDKLPPNHPTTFLAMHNCMNAYRQAGRYDEALSLANELWELSQKVLPPEKAAAWKSELETIKDSTTQEAAPDN